MHESPDYYYKGRILNANLIKPDIPTMNKYANFDRSEPPLISIYFTGAKETDENFSAYLNGLAKNYEAKVPFSLIFELSEAPLPQLKYQLKQAAWMKENKELIQQYCYGVAYVIPGKVLRGVLKFIFSIQKNPVDFKVFSSYEPAKNVGLEKKRKK